MAGKSRVGELYVQIVPTFNDLSAQIEDELEKDGVKFKPEIDTKAIPEEGKKAGAGFGKNFAAAIGAAAIVAGITETFKQLYEIGDTFDAMGDSIRVSTGATGEELENLNRISKNIFTTIPAQAEDVSSVVGDLSKRLGISGETLEGVATQVLEAGRLLGEPIDTEALAQSLRIMNVDVSQYGDAVDGVFRVSQKTGIGMSDLFAGIEGNSAVLKQMGLDFDESASLIGLMDAAGLDAETTLSQMGKGIVKFSKDGEPASEAIKSVIGEIENLVKIGDQAGAISTASEVFGTKGALNFIDAIESGAVSADSFNSSLGSTGDTIIGLAEETNDFAENWQITQNKMAESIEPLATAVFTFAGTLIEDLGPSIQFIADGIAGFSEFASENEGVIISLAAIMGGIMLIAIVGMTAALWGMAAAGFAAMAPFLPIIGGIALVIAAFVGAYLLTTLIFNLIAENWDSIVTFMSEAWANFTGFIGDSITNIGNWFVDLGRNIANFFIGIVNMVIGAMNWMISGINSIGFDTPEWLGGGRVGFNIPLIGTIPQLADGGTIKATGGGTLAMLAEAGRSEVVMDEGKWNNLIDQILTGELGNGGKGSVTYQIYQQPGQSPEDLIRLIEEYEYSRSLNGE